MLWGILLEIVHLVEPIMFYFVLFLYTSDSLPAVVSTPIPSDVFLFVGGNYLERGHFKPRNILLRDYAVPNDVE
jgi:membrane protein DedA with SNARE-associated domain